jgi:hypothetical protein
MPTKTDKKTPKQTMTTPDALANIIDTGEPTYALVEDELTAAEQAVVDASVYWLVAAATRHGVEHAMEVRDHVLTTYFDGDYAAFADPSRSKPRSLRALAARDDLPYSFATLHQLVRVGEQIELLPPGVGRSLTVRHHRALLTVADPELKAALAVEAIEQQLTSDDLADRVREHKPKSNAGRPALPPVIKHVHALRRVFGALVVPKQAAVKGLDAAARADVAKLIAEGRKKLDALEAALAVDG